MKKLLVTYGFIVFTLLVAFISYMVLSDDREAVLAYSLDALGRRLVEMVDDPSQKDAIANLFDQFKGDVLANNVAPEQVEDVAANVLNLSNSNARLTSEQAELVLQSASVAPDSTQPLLADATPLPVADTPQETPTTAPVAQTAPAAPTPPVPPVAASPAVAPPPTVARPPVPGVQVRTGGNRTGVTVVRAAPSAEQMAALGQRLQHIITFNEQLERVVTEQNAARDVLAAQVRYQVENGQVVVKVDEGMRAQLQTREMAVAENAVRSLESAQLLVWRNNLTEQYREERQRMLQEMRVLEAVLQRHEQIAEGQKGNLAALAHLKSLEAFGYRSAFSSDSLRLQLTRQLKGTLSEREQQQVEAYLEDLMEEAEDALEDRLDFLEDQLDDAMDRMDEELETLKEAYRKARTVEGQQRSSTGTGNGR